MNDCVTCTTIWSSRISHRESCRDHYLLAMSILIRIDMTAEQKLNNKYYLQLFTRVLFGNELRDLILYHYISLVDYVVDSIARIRYM